MGPRSVSWWPRRVVAVNAGKVTALASKALGKGGGTALPGVVATRIYEDLTRDLARQLEHGSFLVSGTNGKTTTSRMLADILRAGNYTPLRNHAGSNLMRGITSSLVLEADRWGNVRRHTGGMGLFEVDEAALPGLIRVLEPRGVLLLDLFRDQLDRYGEVATVARLWSKALALLPPSTGVVVNGDDPLLTQATSNKSASVCFFGVESAERTARVAEHASDVKACPRCGNRIQYSSVFLGHLGHYACTVCDLARPNPSVWADNVRLHGVDGSSFQLCTSEGVYPIELPLPGMYNVYNAVAAAAAATWFHLPLTLIAQALQTATPAFGRMERLPIEGRIVYIALAKNPAGLNEVLRTAVETDGPLNLMMMLNDNTADGHDVSWIWDADVEILQGRAGTIVFSGTRAADMALRFKYGGVLETRPEPRWELIGDTASAFESALALTPVGGRLIIVPTYTALLDVRNTLTRLRYVKPYWEE